jgi:hypothetical protein
MTYADHFALLARDVGAEYRRIDAHLARIEATSDRIKAAEAHEIAIAALVGLRKIAQDLDTDVAIRNARGVA